MGVVEKLAETMRGVANVGGYDVFDITETFVSEAEGQIDL